MESIHCFSNRLICLIVPCSHCAVSIVPCFFSHGSAPGFFFCITDVTFSHAEPLAPTFSAIFKLEVILDLVAGCLKFCGVTPDEFGGVDPSEIIQVNPPPQAEVLKQPYVGSIRMLDLVMEKGSASAAQNHFGPEGETRFKGEGSSFSSSYCQRRTFRGLDSGSRDFGYGFVDLGRPGFEQSSMG